MSVTPQSQYAVEFPHHSLAFYHSLVYGVWPSIEARSVSIRGVLLRTILASVCVNLLILFLFLFSPLAVCRKTSLLHSRANHMLDCCCGVRCDADDALLEHVCAPAKDALYCLYSNCVYPFADSNFTAPRYYAHVLATPAWLGRVHYRHDAHCRLGHHRINTMAQCLEIASLFACKK